MGMEKYWHLKPAGWKVMGERVELGTNQEVSQFLHYNPRKIQEFKTHGLPDRDKVKLKQEDCLKV